MIFSQNDIRVREVRIVNLIHKFLHLPHEGSTTPSPQTATIFAMLLSPAVIIAAIAPCSGTKSDAASDIDADAEVKVLSRAEQCTGNITGRIVVR
ncbi:MAG: hypothetical protein M0C28_34895 [Candidatus Moduliflexus flocculans]|nr:hypothetical protein [Candidatus Moduliflexus flocculans]